MALVEGQNLKASHRNRNVGLVLALIVLVVLIVVLEFPQAIFPNVAVSGRPTNGFVTVESVVFTNENGQSFTATLNPDGLYYVTLPNGHDYTVQVSSQISTPFGNTPGSCTTSFSLHTISGTSTFDVNC